MDKEIFSLTFNSPELLWLASQLSISPLLQMKNYPQNGGDKQAFQKAQDTLVARQYIAPQPDGRLAVDVAVAGLVGALAYAETALVVTHIKSGESHPRTRQIYRAADLLVEHEQSRHDQHTLTAIPNRATLQQRLQDFLHLMRQSAPRAAACTVPASVINDVPYVVAGDGDYAGAVLLEKAGAPHSTATALAKALARPLRQSSLHTITWQNGQMQPTTKSILLEELYGLWWLRFFQNDTTPMVEILPCEVAGAQVQLEAMVESFN